VWPGALLVDGEVRGTWRRDGQVVSVDVWSRLGARRRAAVAGEAVALPVAVGRAIEVIWS
jgi:hypothetical protein